VRRAAIALAVGTGARGSAYRRPQRIWSLGDGLTVELEAETGYRFGSETTGEVWTALLVRYDDFPWNDRVHTTVRRAPA
jgi:hypothetical protein